MNSIIIKGDVVVEQFKIYTVTNENYFQTCPPLFTSRVDLVDNEISLSKKSGKDKTYEINGKKTE